jgi:adenylate kinase
MIIILLGAPGSGKGTQAELLSKAFDIPKLSTGEMVRTEIQAETALGKRIQQITNSGQLVSDDIIIELVNKRLTENDCQNGFILDGFPRTITQAEELESILLRFPKSKTFVITYDVSESVLVKRLSGRFSCKDCGAGYHVEFHKPVTDGICDKCGSNNFIHRPDDNEEAVTVRLKVYKDKTAPLINYYKSKEKLYVINGMQSIDAISEDTKALITGNSSKFAVV